MFIPSINWTAIKWIAIGLTVVVAFAFGWNLGSGNLRAEWDAANSLAMEAEIQKERKDQLAADVVGANVASASLKERVVYRTLIKEIPRYVESDCDLSAGFRVFHDAAATATVPDPGTAGTDAAPVKAQDVASTVSENYESCRDNERRLEALQEIIRNFNQE